MLDEIDSLFFSDAPKIVDGRLISSIILLNKYKVIGMTATFRGQKGLDKIVAFLKGSAVVNIGKAEQERKLQLDVFGKCQANEIEAKVIEVAKIK